MRFLKKLTLWIFTLYALFAALGLAFTKNVATPFAVLFVIWILPIDKYQRSLKSFFPNKWIKTLISFILLATIYLSITYPPKPLQQNSDNDNLQTESTESEFYDSVWSEWESYASDNSETDSYEYYSHASESSEMIWDW